MMFNFTKEDVIQDLESQLRHLQKEVKQPFSDLGYWSAVAKSEFIKANLKYLNEQNTSSAE